MKEFEGYTYIEGGALASKGFLANGINCGLNSDTSKNDLGLLYCEIPCNTAAVYTTNKVKGAPITVTMEHLKRSNGIAKAIIVNSKNANTCNVNGIELANKVSQLVANELSISEEEVIIASTGVIGEPLSFEPFKNHMKELVQGLNDKGNDAMENAMMTTDTIPKQVAVSFYIGDTLCHLGGMAKGSGMIHPNMATTLNFITTDAGVSKECLQKALSDVVSVTYNCLSIDGDTSTNDMVSFMANGLAGNTLITEENEDFQVIKQALYIVMMNLTRMLAKDGEGATKLIECELTNAPTKDIAITVAKSIIHSPLVKCAIFGEDANWGRILCALGYAKGEFNTDHVDVSFSSKAGSIEMCKDSGGVPFSEEKASAILAEDEITIHVSLNQGTECATAWGCDLTYDYVKINGDYRS